MLSLTELLGKEGAGGDPELAVPTGAVTVGTVSEPDRVPTAVGDSLVSIV